MNIQHDLFKELVGGNYVGPVRDLLARRPLQRQIKVLDLCTGTGKWSVALLRISSFSSWLIARGNLRRVVEMAEEFPHVKFNALDIGQRSGTHHNSVPCSLLDTAPIATRTPPNNVDFEVHDVTTSTRFPPRSFDFVHARHCSLLPVRHPYPLFIIPPFVSHTKHPPLLNFT